jgi:hypothetical protein
MLPPTPVPMADEPRGVSAEVCVGSPSCLEGHTQGGVSGCLEQQP